MDIIAALHRRNISLSQLAIANGYSHRSALTLALRSPYPKSEAIIAAALDLKPQDIWPSRYNTNGTPNRTKGRKAMQSRTLPLFNSTSLNSAGNIQTGKRG